MFIPGQFYVLGMGDSKTQPNKLGWVRLGQMVTTRKGNVMLSSVLPILNYWKTDPDGKETALGRQLAKIDVPGEVFLVDIDYVFTSRKQPDGTWRENHTLAGVDRVVNRGRDTVANDALLPTTKKENK